MSGTMSDSTSTHLPVEQQNHFRKKIFVIILKKYPIFYPRNMKFL